MSRSVQILLLTLICFVCFFINRSVIVPDIMESRNYITAQEMIRYDNWLAPTLNGEPRLAKPPLPTWITAGWASLFKNYRSISLLRIPAAAVASLMVLFLFLLARQFTDDNLMPFLSAAILATSFYFNYVGRINTWDIFCHSFMVIGIWLGVKGLKTMNYSWMYFIGSGILAGLSFLSKGPIAFYTVLLPFMIAYPIFYGFHAIKKNKWNFMIAVILCLAIGLAWPAYTWFFQKDVFMEVLRRETTAWAEHRSRPFYHYWSFPIQTGIWTLIVVFSLAYNYLAKKVKDVKSYKLFFWWAILALILLSIVPEKKERYLLPTFIPLALMSGTYMSYLIRSFRSKTETGWDRIVFGVNALIVSIAGLAMIPVHYIFGFQKEIFSLPIFIILSILASSVCIFSLVFWRKRRVVYSFFVMIFLVGLVNIFSLPLVAKPFTNPLFKEFPDYGRDPKYSDLKIFSEIKLKPEYLWMIGKRVTWLSDLVLEGQTTNGPFPADPYPRISKFESQVHLEEAARVMGKKFIFIGIRNPDPFLIRNFKDSEISFLGPYYPGSHAKYEFHVFLVKPKP